jgi:hypothetical protein
MAPQNETDNKAEEWFNNILKKLRYHQDYTICFGHSKNILNDDGSQKGISIRRPYICLFSTGVTKVYEIVVLGEELPDVKYSESEEDELDKEIEKAEELHWEQS